MSDAAAWLFGCFHPPVENHFMTLQVSSNRRFLIQGDEGTPFFYLGDTAWELFHRLSREEAELYLQTRAAQKFTVIQAVILAEHEFEKPGPSGSLPLQENDPTRPNEAYFAHVDWIVRRANQLGLVVGLLPTWGDKWNRGTGQGPEIFTPENACLYGRFLGTRYREADIIWILGGDRPVETEEHRAIIRATALGLAEGDGGTHLKLFHPPGGRSASDYFAQDAWLDGDMLQSGHVGIVPNYERITRDYQAVPTRPVLDGEPCYEDHPVMTMQWTPTDEWFDAHAVRRAAYWAVFAGAHGHTYGCHDIWQFLDLTRFIPVTAARTPWQTALQFPGANQMRHLRALLESRPFLTRIPDQTLLLSETGGADHLQATRDSDGSYAFVYSPTGQSFTLDLIALSGETLTVFWFDPRTGQAQSEETIVRTASHTFTPPVQGEGQDWVLVLDDAAENYALPGTISA
jgi:hypothetical protein